MKPKLKVSWFSAGVSSFIAAYLAKDIDKVIYIDIADQHKDSMRFVKECETVLNKPIEILRSTKYKTVDECMLGYGMVRLVSGFAPCTHELKKNVRKEWEQRHKEYDVTYVWGMDLQEKERAERLDESMPEFYHEFSLIENQLKKEDCHAICRKLGVQRPFMYDMGYRNNNCVGCVKGGMWYWNKIRKDFPEVFKQRAETERRIGFSCLKECYLDELEPNRGRMEDEIAQDCSIFCELAIR